MTARPEGALDWVNPDYVPIFRARADRLVKLRNDPMLLAAVREHYRLNPSDFISDWGCTNNPERPELGVFPFILFPRQREFCAWVLERLANKESGICEKSRSIGASWLAMCLSVTLCLFNKNYAIGVGSRKEELIDSPNDLNALFPKARAFLRLVPPEFRGEWEERKHSSHRKIMFPWNNSAIVGEAGDQIGRGGRSTIFWCDEAAYFERPKLIDAALSANTSTRIDLSSVNGMANSFAERRHSGRVPVFTFHYRSDPRKTEQWAEKKRAELDDVVWAAEYEINYSASVEGIIIPAAWVLASLDAHVKLGIAPTGAKRGALDVADGGVDRNAFGVQHGILLEHVESWKGGASLDIYHTVERAFVLCDSHNLDGFVYDADGLGAGVRGDARKVNEARTASNPRAPNTKRVDVFRGSGGVFEPERIVKGTERKAIDFFENFKAQSWWMLRDRFKETYRAVVEGVTDYDPANIISISSKIAELPKLQSELSQPVWALSKTGKVMVVKADEGTLSPNLADTAMMLYAPRRAAMAISADVLEMVGRGRR